MGDNNYLTGSSPLDTGPEPKPTPAKSPPKAKKKAKIGEAAAPAPLRADGKCSGHVYSNDSQSTCVVCGRRSV